MTIFVEIHIISGKQDGFIHRLNSNDHGNLTEKGYWEIVIGRDAKNTDVCIRDDFASRQHVKLRVDGKKLWLIDLNSSNGVTLINPHDFFKDRKLSPKELAQKKLPISPGQPVCIGRTWLQIAFTRQEDN